MSPDLRALLNEAAPRPARAFDPAAIERRARRIVAGRAVVAVLAVLAVAGGSVVAASFEPPERATEVGNGDRGAVPGPNVDVHDDERRVPRGTRHELTSGVHGDDWDEPWAGRRWRLLVWGTPKTSCWQVAEEGAEKNSGVGCTHNDGPVDRRNEVFSGTTSFETGSRDPDEYAFVAGALGPRVARLELRRGRGPAVSIPIYEPPARTRIAYRYYATVLPRYGHAWLVALDEHGEVLGRHGLCGELCRLERDLVAEADALQFGIEPVSLESAAAAFATEAAARAGLLDQLGTFWSYREISRSDLVAEFDAGAIDVGVEGDRFFVESVRGTTTSMQREALESYTAPVTDDEREWRLVAESFARTGKRKWEAAFVALWTGNVGAPHDYGSRCRFGIYDARGRALHRTELLFEVRANEAGRVDGLTTSVRSKRRPVDLELDCDPPGLLRER